MYLDASVLTCGNITDAIFRLTSMEMEEVKTSKEGKVGRMDICGSGSGYDPWESPGEKWNRETPLPNVSSRGAGTYLFCLLESPQGLDQGLTHSKYPIVC